MRCAVILAAVAMLGCGRPTQGAPTAEDGVRKLCLEGVAYWVTANDWDGRIALAVDRSGKPIPCEVRP